MKSMLLMVGLVICVSAAAGQPVLDASSYQLPDGGVITAKQFDVLAGQTALEAILAATGPNQTYDFAQFTYAPATTYTFEIRSSAAGTPGALDATLNTANYVFLGPNTVGTLGYGYYLLDNSGYGSLGNVIVYDSDSDGTVDTTYSVFDPPHTFAEFPLTEGTEWTETVTNTTRSVFGEFQSVRDVHGEVEGWGNLVLPDRTLPTVRLRRTFTQTGLTFSTVEFKTAGTYEATIVLGIGGGIQLASYSFIEEGGTTAREEVATTDFAVQPSYPNPVRDTAVIPIHVSKPGSMCVSVFDLLGREVARPLDGFVTAGRHNITVDTGGLPSGVYVYRVSADSGYRAGRMVVRR